MSNVEEEIVREYFEGNRFLVRRLPGPAAPARKKGSDDGSELLVFNPGFQSGGRKPGFLLFSSELEYMEWAVIVVKVWPAARFSPAVVKSGSKLVRFLEQNVPKKEETSLPELEGVGKEAVRRILVLPGLPTTEPHRQQSIELLEARGFDGMISFRSMLLEIITRADGGSDRRGTDLLELVRVLRNYEMIRDSQMELFGR